MRAEHPATPLQLLVLTHSLWAAAIAGVYDQPSLQQLVFEQRAFQQFVVTARPSGPTPPPVLLLPIVRMEKTLGQLHQLIKVRASDL